MPGKNLQKIYVTDLDGTLLSNEGKLSEYSFLALKKLIEDGANITIASARSLSAIKRLLNGIELNLPVIEINGAYLSDWHTSRHLCINDIPQNVAEEVCNMCTDFGCVPFVAAFDGNEDHLFYEVITNEGMEWFVADKCEDKNDLPKQRKITAEILNMNIVCFVVIGSMEVVGKLNDCIRSRFPKQLDSYFFLNPYTIQWQWLTIHDRNAQKSIAIKELIDLKGFSIDNLTVFGDEDNDKTMMELNLQGAKSVAVDNAADHIKKLATEICQSNQNDGVIKYIENDFYNR